LNQRLLCCRLISNLFVFNVAFSLSGFLLLREQNPILFLFLNILFNLFVVIFLLVLRRLILCYIGGACCYNFRTACHWWDSTTYLCPLKLYYWGQAFITAVILYSYMKPLYLDKWLIWLPLILLALLKTVEAERISVDHVAHLKPSDGGSAATQCEWFSCLVFPLQSCYLSLSLFFGEGKQFWFCFNSYIIMSLHYILILNFTYLVPNLDKRWELYWALNDQTRLFLKSMS
jgi:hypothetical protein